jgi:hypothetical protein
MDRTPPLGELTATIVSVTLNVIAKPGKPHFYTVEIASLLRSSQ